MVRLELKHVRHWALFSLAIAVMGMIACGGEAEPAEPVEVTREVEVTKIVEQEKVVEKEVVVTATSEPIQSTVGEPKTGGTLRLVAHGPPAHFDFFQSGSIANLGWQAGMFNQLVRRDPADASLPIIPDLATDWEISPDGKTYTFNLREGVKFHDGSDFSAEDVKATYERIAFPDRYQKGLASVRKNLWSSLDSIEIVDPYTVSFHLKEKLASAFMMQLFSMQWNLILDKDTLEQFDGDLKDAEGIPGTGPFKFVEYSDEGPTVTRNADYWNEGFPRVDTIEHTFHTAWTPPLAAALLSGNADWTMWLAPDVGRTVGEREGINAINQIATITHQIRFNTERGPFQDKRVRRAFALVLDPQAIVEATADQKGFKYGGYFLDGTEFATPTEVLKSQPITRRPTDEDIAEAKRLMAEAGYPNGEGMPTLSLATRDTPSQRTIMALVKSVAKEHFNVDAEIKIHDVSGAARARTRCVFDIEQNGIGLNFADPSAYIDDLKFDPNADDADCRWNNPEMNQLADDLRTTLDQEARKDIAEQIKTLLYEEVPRMPFAGGEIIYHGYWDHLKGMVPGDFTSSYELHRWERQWLDRN